MKKLVLILSLALLAGCATAPQEKRIIDVRLPEYLRAQRHLPLSFSKIQTALFKHQQACGSSPEFTVDPDMPSEARVTQKLSKNAGWDKTILIDLLLLQDLTVKAKAYSYYPGNEGQIDQVFNAITHPTVCP